MLMNLRTLKWDPELCEYDKQSLNYLNKTYLADIYLIDSSVFLNIFYQKLNHRQQFLVILIKVSFKEFLLQQ